MSDIKHLTDIVERGFDELRGDMREVKTLVHVHDREIERLRRKNSPPPVVTAQVGQSGFTITPQTLKFLIPAALALFGAPGALSAYQSTMVQEELQKAKEAEKRRAAEEALTQLQSLRAQAKASRAVAEWDTDMAEEAAQETAAVQRRVAAKVASDPSVAAKAKQLGVELSDAGK